MAGPKSYIYIDTNVISNFKLFSDDEWRAYRNANNKYLFPASASHFLDLLKSPEEYLQEDLLLLEKISGRNYIDLDESGSIVTTKLPFALSEAYEHIVSDYKSKTKPDERFVFIPGYDKFTVDTEMMHSNSFLYDMVVQNHGVIDGNFGNYVMQYMLANIDSPTVYKAMRKQIQDIIAHAKKYGTYNSMPDHSKQTLEIFSFEGTDDELFMRLKEYMILSYRIQGKNWLERSIPHQIVDIYSLLDLVSGYGEKIDKKNPWVNMLHDAEHCANASQAKYYITNERKNNAKIDFIKTQFGLKFKVITPEQFISTFRL
ncbi:TPA: hypothetical protein ACV4JC_000635 [Salmonella enterica]